MEFNVHALDCRLYVSITDRVLLYSIPLLCFLLLTWAVIAWGLKQLERKRAGDSR